VNVEVLTTRAPIDCRVLQVNINPGEYTPSTSPNIPAMLLGGLEHWHIRTDINESDAWRFMSNQKAMAYVRGNNKMILPLKFKYVEPYVVPKKSLTGDSGERVDTRVLQVIYSFDPLLYPNQIFFGQQMDVFIESEH
jgi:HlyD family secretion protein